MNKNLVPEINLPKPNGDVPFMDFVFNTDKKINYDKVKEKIIEILPIASKNQVIDFDWYTSGNYKFDSSIAIWFDGMINNTHISKLEQEFNPSYVTIRPDDNVLVIGILKIKNEKYYE